MHTLNKWVLMAALLHGAWAAQAQELRPLELEAEQRSISRTIWATLRPGKSY